MLIHPKHTVKVALSDRGCNLCMRLAAYLWKASNISLSFFLINHTSHPKQRVGSANDQYIKLHVLMLIPPFLIPMAVDIFKHSSIDTMVLMNISLRVLM